MYKGEVMQHGPRAGQKIETYKDLADYLEWQYANGLITEKQRDDTLIIGQVDFPGESTYTPSPWNNEGESPKYGQIIPGVVREFLVHKKIMDYNEAVEFSNLIDEQLQGADWLTLYDGTTYTKTFVPKRR